MANHVNRQQHLREIKRKLDERPVVALLGARRVGKTTMARELAKRWNRPVTFFDLEDNRDLALLQEPTLALLPLRGLVVLDEIHHVPDLFKVLRVLADRPRTPARFLVLGSASPELLRQSSETLAGRVAFHEIMGFDLGEVGSSNLEKLWIRGCFPQSFLSASNRASAEWRQDFIRTFVERDLPQLGSSIPARTIERFWNMLAHHHGQVLNASEIGTSFGVSHTTVRRYLDLLAATFVVRILPPWFENVGKRVIKSPKVYLSDSGILHTLLGLETLRDVERHPKLGFSWEGFILEQVIRRLGAAREQCFFWATHSGAELDLLVVQGTRRLGFEFKRTDAPRVTPSMTSAIESLGLSELIVVHAGSRSFPMNERIQAIAASELLDRVKPLRR